MLVHCKVTPSIKFTGAHLYTWVERDTVRVKCLPMNTMQFPRPGLEPGPLDLDRTKHKATAPPTENNNDFRFLTRVKRVQKLHPLYLAL